MSQIKKKIEESAGFYNKSFLKIDYLLADYGFKTLQPYFQGSCALEIGPASGYMTKELVRSFDTLYLLEASQELINQIPDYQNVVKINELIENFTTDRKFDTIIMSHVLEHIASPPEVLTRIKGLLAPDGVFLIAVPNAKSIHRLVAVQMGLLTNEYELNSRDHELGHYRVYDLETLEAHVKAAGFRVIKSGGYFLKPLSNGQMEEQWSLEVIEGFYKVGSVLPEYCAEIFVVCKNG